MWIYEKKLEYPVKITQPNPGLAKVIISQLGGPDGEMGASVRYLQQRYTMPNGQIKGALTDIGTEELAHMELVSAILYQLTRNLSIDQIKSQGFDTYFIDHTTGIYPQAASGVPFSAGTLQVTGDPIADLFEDMAAEQKARLTYDNILRLAAGNPEVLDPIRFLREREIVHFQRFGECLRVVQDHLDAKNFYAFNPSFDRSCYPPDRITTPKTIPVPAEQLLPASCGNGTVRACEQPTNDCTHMQTTCCPPPQPCCTPTNTCCPAPQVCCKPVNTCCSAPQACCTPVNNCCPAPQACCTPVNNCCPAPQSCNKPVNSCSTPTPCCKTTVCCEPPVGCGDTNHNCCQKPCGMPCDQPVTQVQCPTATPYTAPCAHPHHNSCGCG